MIEADTIKQLLYYANLATMIIVPILSIIHGIVLMVLYLPFLIYLLYGALIFSAFSYLIVALVFSAIYYFLVFLPLKNEEYTFQLMIIATILAIVAWIFLSYWIYYLPTIVASLLWILWLFYKEEFVGKVRVRINTKQKNV